MLHHMSNGEFISAPHCVKNKSHTTTRYSAIYFFDMAYDTVVEPVVREGQTRIYQESIHFGEYLVGQLTKNYTRPKEN